MAEFVPFHQFTLNGNLYSAGHSYLLNLLLYPDGIQFALFDQEMGHYSSLQEYRLQKPADDASYCDKIATFFKTEVPVEEISISKAFIATAWPYYSLVPSSVYDPERRDEYLKFISRVPPSYKIMGREITGMGAFLVNALPPCLFSMLQEFFPDATFCHSMHPLVKSLYLYDKKQARDRSIYIHGRKEFLDIIVFESGRLIFCNSFAYSAKEDFIYYVLFTLEQLQYNPENIRIIILGETDKSSAEFQLLNKYVQELKFINTEQERNALNQWDEKLAQHFYNLLKLKTCE